MFAIEILNDYFEVDKLDNYGTIDPSGRERNAARLGIERMCNQRCMGEYGWAQAAIYHTCFNIQQPGEEAVCVGKTLWKREGV